MPPLADDWQSMRSHPKVSRGFEDRIEWREREVAHAGRHHRAAIQQGRHLAAANKSSILLLPLGLDLDAWNPDASEDPLTRFNRLAAEWKEDTQFLSSPEAIMLHPSYMEIIGMGIPAVPLILADLRREPNQWFWALRAILGADIAEGAESLPAAVAAWLDWGERHDIIAHSPE